MNLNPSITKGVIVFLVCVLLTACSASDLREPLPNASHRATPLSFGLHVTPDPETNPIDPPERFSGYHAALDFEVSAGEREGDVPVYAICSGKVVYSGFADGYGGLLVHRCKIKGEDVTVLYGHLSRVNLPKEGDTVRAGQTVALLADARSYDSDGNRKHLHLGIHKGRNLSLSGYVQTTEELENYIDPAQAFAFFGIDLPGSSPGEVPYWQKEVDVSAD